MTSSNERYGRRDAGTQAILKGLQADLVPFLVAYFTMVASRMDDLGWYEGDGKKRLSERFLENLGHPAVLRMEELVLRAQFCKVCGPGIVKIYGSASVWRMVNVIIALNKAKKKVKDWETWMESGPRKVTEDDLALTRVVLADLTTKDLGLLQRKLTAVNNDRNAMTEAYAPLARGAKDHRPGQGAYINKAKAAITRMDRQEVDGLLRRHEFEAIAIAIVDAVA